MFLVTTVACIKEAAFNSLPIFALKSSFFLSTFIVREKTNILSLVKTVSEILFRTIVTGIGTTAMGFCSKGERLGSTLNIT